MILAIDHFQVSIPAGGVPRALDFYVDILGFTRIAKPAYMDQSGAWLIGGSVNLHLGERKEGETFTTSPDAHPAIRVDNFQALMRLAEQKGLKIRVDKGPSGFYRGSIWDPFGNRIELMQKL